MGIHTTDAIILRRYPYRETSVLVSCLTDRFGKVKGLVKGLRGERQRYRSAMEPLTLNRIVFYDTRTGTLHLISQCELLAAFVELPRELEVIQCASLCAELVDVVVHPGDPQPMIFRLLKETLQRLAHICALQDAQRTHEVTATRVHFVLRLLRLAGFQPQLDECTGCGRAPHEGGFWSARQGGLLCNRCLHEDPEAIPIGVRYLEALAHCADVDEPGALAEHEMVIIDQRLDEFLRWRLERPLKTLRQSMSGTRSPGGGRRPPHERIVSPVE